MTLLAIVLAAAAACFFAAAVRLQHRSVQTADATGLRFAGAVLRNPRWLGGTSLAVLGGALHLTALSLAPLAIVQPIGVLSLVLTVGFGNPDRTSRVVAATVAVCAGVGGFVLLSAASVGSAAVPGLAVAQPVLLLGAGAAAVAWFVRGQAKCLTQAAAAAVLFGLGAATMRVAALHLLHGTPGAGVLLAAEAGLLLLTGGWLLHRAYASGPAAVAVAATTVVDPFTAILASALLFGERPFTSPVAAAVQAGLAAVAIIGVVVLAYAKPSPRTVQERPMPQSRLRIVIGADTFPPDVNGAAHFAERLARGLSARGHDVHILTPDRAGIPGQDGGYTIHYAASHRTPFHETFRFSTPRRARRTAAELLSELRPDVVHVQSHFSVGRGLLSAAGERGIPTVATNHFMPENLLGFVSLPKPVESVLTRWAWRDFVRVFRRAGVVTTPTPRAAQLLEEHGFPGPVAVVSCGIDLGHYAPVGPAPADAVRVLFVGRLDAEKNVDDLIRALPKVPSLHATLIGDGSCRADLEELAARAGVADRVTFRGFVTDAELVQAYRTSHLFCMPGTAELQSLATMEAMAAGLAVVAADAMALPHLVASGRTGWLYPPGDIEALAERLLELTADPAVRARMGRAGQEAVAHHGIARTLDAYEDLYEAATGALPRPRVTGQAA
ncbi:glycosyltransferase [Amycolatopsis benzoatilytica]|uniref:glycosyltransferase n=1 Tax=Amycolatopsis benzoatilytica TaxID=346045 RepID=UPI00036830F4|nr:glycosyltransferase [Amycolatopsis benzoatilytica]